MATLTENLLDQFKLQIQTLAQATLGQRLAGWIARLLAHVKLEDTSPRLVVRGEEPVGDAPPEVKAEVLRLVQKAIAYIEQPMARLFLTSLVVNILPRLIDQAYDAIFFQKASSFTAAAANDGITDFADAKACDDQLPPVK